MRLILVIMVLALATVAWAQEPEVACVLKGHNGTVRIIDLEGHLKVAQVGPVFMGETIVVDRDADVTLIAGQETITLDGPLEIKLTEELTLTDGEDGQSLISRLANLLPGLPGAGKVDSGSVKTVDYFESESTEMALIGPRGDVLFGPLRFKPYNAYKHFTLEITDVNTGNTLRFWLVTAEPFELDGFFTDEYIYSYQIEGVEDQEFTTTYFNMASREEIDATKSLMETECRTNVERALWLSKHGYYYDAWLMTEWLLDSGEHADLQTLLESINTRLADKLLGDRTPVDDG